MQQDRASGGHTRYRLRICAADVSGASMTTKTRRRPRETPRTALLLTPVHSETERREGGFGLSVST